MVWNETPNNGSSPQCGAVITTTNWTSGVKIFIQAGLDNLKDMTQWLTLEISVTLEVGIQSTTNWTHTISDTVKVIEI